MTMILIEGLVACFLLLIPCVVGIANGPVSLVCLYEKEVQDRVVEKGLITRERINRNANYFRLFGILPFFIFVLVAVYVINGAHGFWDGFWQISVILLIEGLFDRLFIDWYWVGKTKAWIIPGTEDLMPYIYGKTLIGKWVFTLVGYPFIAAVLSLIMSLILR
ncbi:MAG: hypothetical protein K6B38_01130 [Ruminococcus sp.]|nr:hypothetical protein [Ruminococcus sp.]